MKKWKRNCLIICCLLFVALIFVFCMNRNEKCIKKYFDAAGNRYRVCEYDDKNELIKHAEYNQYGIKKFSNKYTYEYDEKGNVVKSYSKFGDTISHYKYDELNRLIYSWEEYKKGITYENYFSERYLYDEEGRLSRVEVYCNDSLDDYTVYEYDGLMLMKEAKYCLEGELINEETGERRVTEVLNEYTVYEYDENGWKVKSTFYDESHNCRGYNIYEHDKKGREVKCSHYDELNNCTGYETYEYR